VTKFANRKTATERIWRAIQNLGGAAPSPEPAIDAEIAGAEPIAQAEPAPENVAPLAASESTIPPAELQADSEPTSTSQSQEASVATVDIATEPATPFDEPVASVGAQVAHVAPETPAPTKKATRAKKTPTGAADAKAPREKPRPAR
jgi:hypothetical protein